MPEHYVLEKRDRTVSSVFTSAPIPSARHFAVSTVEGVEYRWRHALGKTSEWMYEAGGDPSACRRRVVKEAWTLALSSAVHIDTVIPEGWTIPAGSSVHFNVTPPDTATEVLARMGVTPKPQNSVSTTRSGPWAVSIAEHGNSSDEATGEIAPFNASAPLPDGYGFDGRMVPGGCEYRWQHGNSSCTWRSYHEAVRDAWENAAVHATNGKLARAHDKYLELRALMGVASDESHQAAVARAQRLTEVEKNHWDQDDAHREKLLWFVRKAGIGKHRDQAPPADQVAGMINDFMEALRLLGWSSASGDPIVYVQRHVEEHARAVKLNREANHPSMTELLEALRLLAWVPTQGDPRRYVKQYIDGRTAAEGRLAAMVNEQSAKIDGLTSTIGQLEETVKRARAGHDAAMRAITEVSNIIGPLGGGVNGELVAETVALARRVRRKYDGAATVDQIEPLRALVYGDGYALPGSTIETAMAIISSLQRKLEEQSARLGQYEESVSKAPHLKAMHSLLDQVRRLSGSNVNPGVSVEELCRRAEVFVGMGHSLPGKVHELRRRIPVDRREKEGLHDPHKIVEWANEQLRDLPDLHALQAAVVSAKHSLLSDKVYADNTASLVHVVQHMLWATEGFFRIRRTLEGPGDVRGMLRAAAGIDPPLAG